MNDMAGPAESGQETGEKPDATLTVRARRRDRPSRSGAGRTDETEGWVVTYMDMITLLLALFAVLISMSDFEKGGGMAMVESFRESVAAAMKAERVSEADQNRAASGDAPQPIPLDLGSDGLLERMRALVADPRLAGEADVVLRDGNPSIRLRSDVLFSSGSAELTYHGGEVLDVLVPLLHDARGTISVEGHTDDIPIDTGRFPSNWELSSTRASVVVRFLEYREISPDRLRAIGYGASKPDVEEDTAEGRMQNRRVELVVHRDRRF